MQLQSNTILKSQTTTYIIDQMIGQGGFGITYKGRMQQKLRFKTIEMTVCIKELFIGESCGRRNHALTFSNTAFKDRFAHFKKKFLREAHTLAEFQEEKHIVTVLDIFEANNTAYIVMDYIDGQSLGQYLKKQGKCSIPQALKYIRQVGKALEAAHKINIYHLDVKPDNILLNPQDDAILIDFGISKQLEAGKTSITSTTRAFTDGYAAIEQYSKSARVRFSPATDVYALAATLYRCLTGIRPEGASSRMFLDTDTPQSLNPSISDTLSKAILKGMETKPKDRPKTVPLFLGLLLDAAKEEEIVIEGKIVAEPKKAFDFCEMVYVEGGSFMMGSNENSDEKPIHKVNVPSFHIGKYPVTQKEWVSIMGKNPSHFKGDNRPVEQVSWNDIEEFIKKLNAKTGKNYRLPSEAEWEYAARGGKASKGYKYSGSNTIEEVAWYDKNSYDKGSEHKDYGTHPVGQKNPNELGLYDMSGNVFEWCEDKWHSNYESAPIKGNAWIDGDTERRVLRGGSWYSDGSYCRTTYRDYFNPDFRSHGIGFRLSHS